jgi:hypothetical protein
LIADADEDGNRLLRDGHLYQLVREHHAIRERALEITLTERGLRVHVRLARDRGTPDQPSPIGANAPYPSVARARTTAADECFARYLVA